MRGKDAVWTTPIRVIRVVVVDIAGRVDIPSIIAIALLPRFADARRTFCVQPTSCVYLSYTKLFSITGFIGLYPIQNFVPKINDLLTPIHHSFRLKMKVMFC